MTRQFDFTLDDLKVWFNEYNEKYFNGELKMTHFAVNLATRQNGCFNGSTYTITMSKQRDRTEFWYRNTFIHEMIHCWQYSTKQPDYFGVGRTKRSVHGESFKRKAAEINKDGWQITRCSADHASSVTPTRTRAKSEYKNLVIWESAGGEKRWCLLAEKNLEETIAWYVEHYPENHQGLTVYTVPNISGFNGFSTNNSRLAYYQYDKYDYVVDLAISKGSVRKVYSPKLEMAYV